MRGEKLRAPNSIVFSKKHCVLLKQTLGYLLIILSAERVEICIYEKHRKIYANKKGAHRFRISVMRKHDAILYAKKSPSLNYQVLFVQL
jgi:hypothetical protein